MKMKEFQKIRNEIGTAFFNAETKEDLNKLYKQYAFRFHPDNNLTQCGEPEDLIVELFCDIQDLFTEAGKRYARKGPYTVHNGKTKEEKREERKREVLQIRKYFRNAEDFFSSPGSEQITALKGMCGRVAIVLDGKIPTPNKRQITDKHHADKNGNFDGMRSYGFVQYCFNKSRTLNREAIEEAAQTAWIKLAENVEKPEYSGRSFSSIMWVSCRQAINNLYNAEKKHDSYLDKRTDLYDLNAYECKPSLDWTPETKGTYNVWIDSMFNDRTDAIVYNMSKAGYSETETAVECGISQKAVSKRLIAIYDRIKKDRLLEALNANIEDLPVRKNANAKQIIRALIMQGIRNGMSYKRIAYHLHCEPSEIPAMLKTA